MPQDDSGPELQMFTIDEAIVGGTETFEDNSLKKTDDYYYDNIVEDIVKVWGEKLTQLLVLNLK